MVAVATSCDVHPQTKRPILGALNICPGALNPKGGFRGGGDEVSRVVELVVHEMIHVLVRRGGLGGLGGGS